MIVKKMLQRAQVFVVRHKQAALITAGVLLAVVMFQFLYPHGRVLPFARLDGEQVGSHTKTQIVQLAIDHYGNVPLELKITGSAKNTADKTTTAQAGLAPDTERIIKNLMAYPWWQRIVPFSLIIKGLTTNQQIVTQLDDERFTDYASVQLKNCAVQPTNATVAAKNGSVVLVPAKVGQKCDATVLKKVLLRTTLKQKGVAVTIPASTIKPSRNDKDVSSLLKDAIALTEHKITLTLDGTDYPINKATIASWLVFADDAKNKKLTVDVDTTPIRDYLTSMQPKIYVAPGITTVQTIDSVEVSRVEGADGRGLNFTTTADALKTQLLAGDGAAKGDIITIPSRVVYQRTYSATRAGLQALLNDIVADKGDYAISVRTLDGTVTSSNGSKHYHPASTYKMYVAYSLLKRIASGVIKWDNDATGGKNISQCFDLMIINSDNTCAEWFGDTIGWSNINNEVHAIGLSNTNTIRGAMYSTSDDETLFLMKLQNGTLLNAPERDRLLDVMKRQVYRSGIPAGVGVTVADKVGFLDGNLHDAAIVYGKQTYALTIMSNASSWAQIADAARQINAQLARI